MAALHRRKVAGRRQSESRVRENCTHGLTMGRWGDQLQTSGLLYEWVLSSTRTARTETALWRSLPTTNPTHTFLRLPNATTLRTTPHFRKAYALADEPEIDFNLYLVHPSGKVEIVF
jgi:hypothetical protein